MAECVYCGTRAGFFRSEHTDCVSALAQTVSALQKGATPHLATFDATKLFNLRSSERPMWARLNCEAFEVGTARRRVGGFRGFSIPIVRGFSLRGIGRVQSESVDVRAFRSLGRGAFLLTNEQVYFASPVGGVVHRSLEKVVGVQTFVDAIQITADNARTKPLLIMTQRPEQFRDLVMAAARNAAQGHP